MDSFIGKPNCTQPEGFVSTKLDQPKHTTSNRITEGIWNQSALQRQQVENPKSAGQSALTEIRLPMAVNTNAYLPAKATPQFRHIIYCGMAPPMDLKETRNSLLYSR